MAQQGVLEIVLFAAKEGIGDAELLAAAEAVHSWLMEQPGFVSRSLARSEEGRWIDIVRWRTLAEAKAAGESFMTQPVGQRLGAAIDASSIIMLHADEVSRFAAPAAAAHI